MQKHTKIYFSFMGFDESDFIPSELSGEKAVDIHHINARGQGGNPSGDKDNIINLMALTRKEHEHYGDKKQFKEFLQEAHNKVIEARLQKVIPMGLKIYSVTQIPKIQVGKMIHTGSWGSIDNQKGFQLIGTSWQCGACGDVYEKLIQCECKK